jgi:hypothetical protein
LFFQKKVHADIMLVPFQVSSLFFQRQSVQNDATFFFEEEKWHSWWSVCSWRASATRSRASFKGATYWNVRLRAACEGGHREVAEFMIFKGAHHWNSGLCAACEGGHHNVAEWMILKGANNWNRGLYYARKSGHAHMARLMIQKGATKCNACGQPIRKHV